MAAEGDTRDFAERTVVGWHLLFVLMIVVTGVFLTANGNAWPGLPLLGVLVIGYVVLAGPGVRCGDWRRWAYVGLAIVVLGILTWIDPSSLVLLFALYPQWMRDQVAAYASGRVAAPPGVDTGDPAGPGKMVVDLLKAGARIVAGTDSPNAVNLHGELAGYVNAGMTPYQALRAATVTPAEALGLDAGSVEAGKLADLVLVEGNPLEDISAAYRVRRVMVNGRAFELKDLLGNSGRPVSP